WNHALSAAATEDRLWFATSPNMEFVPAPYIGIVEVVLREDYRYGTINPIQWPQLPEEDEFEPLEGATIKTLGLLKRESIAPLLHLVENMSAHVAELHSIKRSEVVDNRLLDLECTMRHAGNRLLVFPCTFRDAAMQVRQAQRYWLMCHAFINFYGTLTSGGARLKDVNVGLMGAFTTDPGIVQCLFEAGIPVWWLRQDGAVLERIRVVRFVQLTRPLSICTAQGSDHGTVLYRGLMGTRHFEVMCRAGHTYRDLSRAPLLVVESHRGYPAAQSQQEYKKAVGWGQDIQTSGHRSQDPAGGGNDRTAATRVKSDRGTNKFLQVEHQWMPPPLPAWRAAADAVDKRRSGSPITRPWGYWIPDPALFVRAHQARAERYFMTWLRVRPGWMYMLRLREAELSAIPTQWWRDFLYGDTGRDHSTGATANALRARQIMHVFRNAFKSEEVDMSPSVPPRWFGRRFATIAQNDYPQILWEMFELGFHQELLAMDRLLVPMRDGEGNDERREDLLARVFHDRSLYTVVRLPEQGDGGFSASLLHKRVPYLEAFRVVLSRWPKCPVSIYAGGPIATNVPADVIVKREEELARFYIEAFYEASGRAPILPHAFPRL
ncbi:hypothetical protein GY45DRAFT_1261265, partial [Cubamyces sp. BRFM 1775]